MGDFKIGDTVIHERTRIVGDIVTLHPYGDGTDEFPMIKSSDGKVHIVSVGTIKKLTVPLGGYHG